jgi:hypothetical protein
MPKTYWAQFQLGQEVVIRHAADVMGTVTAVLWRERALPTYEVSYFHNGVQQQPWIEESRLIEADK